MPENDVQISSTEEEISDAEFEQMLSGRKGFRDKIANAPDGGNLLVELRKKKELEEKKRQEDLGRQTEIQKREDELKMNEVKVKAMQLELQKQEVLKKVEEKEVVNLAKPETSVEPEIKKQPIVAPEPVIKLKVEPVIAPIVETITEIKTLVVKKQQTDDRLLSIPAGVNGEFQFPQGFLWGTSTSAYQIEGGIRNDWSEWEKSKKRSKFLEKQHLNKEDYISNSACDSWNRYAEDFDLAKSLGTNSIRFGIEWARIETGNDVWDVEAIKKYREMLHSAHKKGFKIALTIWHWTNPVWFTEEGGWAGKNAVNYFERFSAFVVKEFGGYVDYWITLNEPMVHVVNGYMSGKFPPNRHNIFKARKVFNNLVKGHKRAYKAIHKLYPEAKVGITGLINDFEPAIKFGPLNILIAKTFHYFWNHRFLRRIRKYMDYVGVDYYFHDRIVCYPPFRKNKGERVTDMGWEIYPKGIYHVLKYLKKFKKPIIIMENGLADEADKYRASFIKEHLYWVHRAIQDGVDVRGYFHWSLLDNFEWAAGFVPKFGLIAVDRKTFVRTIKNSAYVYRDICKENKLVL